jgi:peptidoglycan/xylan/chitin deacetylase (PgdA/CDA1 family)
MRLYAAMSHHGFGHLAQSAPVLEALAGQVAGLELIIRSALPRAVLARRVSTPFEHIDLASDCNFVMHDSLRVDLSRSLEAYRTFHDDWERRVDAEAESLTRLDVEMVYSNVGYLPLAAARRAGIACAGMCSLNWADIFRHYLGHEPGAGDILEQMHDAYAGADLFLRPEPAMPMSDLGNTVAIPPIAQTGQPQPDALRDRLRLATDVRLVLVGMGGIRYRPPVEDWPAMRGMALLVPDDWQVTRPGIHALRDTGMPFGDVLASVDALITKPGYGSYVEAAAAGVPVLTLPRPDWPEAPYLDDWLASHGRMQRLDEAEFLAGNLVKPLEALWGLPSRAPVQALGAPEAARRLAALRG